MVTLHIAVLDKFIPPVINLIRNIKTKNEQFFYTYGDESKYPYEAEQDSIHKTNAKNKISSLCSRYFPLLFKMYRADKIMLHGLNDNYLIVILAFNPWLLKKCYWFVWGGDLYYHDDNIVKPSSRKKCIEFFRKIVIKRIGYIVTYIKGDYELVKKWYLSQAKNIECYMYLSNIPQADCELTNVNKDVISIQIGNSADPSNRHIEILDALKSYKGIKIYIPLSYGNRIYADQIEQYAKKLFHDNVCIINNFMSYSEYTNFLNGIDIAIFNHTRQQAMGNTLMLLSLGKTVFIRNDTTQWQFLNSYGIKIKNAKDINLDLLSQEEKISNIEIIKSNFTKEKLVSQYKLFI